LKNLIHKLDEFRCRWIRIVSEDFVEESCRKLSLHAVQDGRVMCAGILLLELTEESLTGVQIRACFFIGSGWLQTVE
jgi:hypothetical protein